MARVSITTSEEQAVVIPRSREEAVAAFGAGDGVTVIGGGTILMPELTSGRVRPERVLLLGRAGLDGQREDGARLVIGAGVRIADLVDAPEPLGTAARRVGDAEIRSQATLGGNLCATAGADYPRGDLQAPLIALGATVRSAGAGGERVEPVEEFLGGDPSSRLVLEVEVPTDRRGAYASVGRPHAHSYTILAVSGSVGPDESDLRLAAAGAGPKSVRLDGPDGDPAASAGLALADDALASTWYRKKMLPVLVARVLSDLKENA
jgi:aerobic carbon-monoxide dehydrogenase medium subunit